MMKITTRVRKSLVGRRVVSRKTRHIPRGVRRGFLEVYFEGILHDIRDPIFNIRGSMSFCRDFAKNPDLRKRFSSLEEKAQKLNRQYSEIAKTLKNRRIPIWLRKRRVRGMLKALLPEGIELKQEISEIAKQDLSGEDKRILSVLNDQEMNFGICVKLLEEFKKRNFSPKPKVQNIELSSFVREFAKNLVRGRIKLSVDIPKGTYFPMDRFDLERCLINIIGNSIEHNPGCELEVNVRFSEDTAEHTQITSLDFLTVNGKSIPQEIVESPESLYSSTGKIGKGLGTKIMSTILHRYNYYLEAENTPRGPKFTIVFRIPKRLMK